ncbi:MAG: hypothetical protein M1831_006184 [Alyxoria varia]|nr:MAG: hypothetical protein M1831_006184 [Alyxoria varia]
MAVSETQTLMLVQKADNGATWAKTGLQYSESVEAHRIGLEEELSARKIEAEV